jgi:hypothetical protein
MRLLSEFQAEGLLRLAGRRITVVSQDKLGVLAIL